jgi:hypothetical protein
MSAAQITIHDLIDSMTVKQLRRYAIDNGYGITYLAERRKAEILRIIKEIDRERSARAGGAA